MISFDKFNLIVLINAYIPSYKWNIYKMMGFCAFLADGIPFGNLKSFESLVAVRMEFNISCFTYLESITLNAPCGNIYRTHESTCMRIVNHRFPGSHPYETVEYGVIFAVKGSYHTNCVQRFGMESLNLITTYYAFLNKASIFADLFDFAVCCAFCIYLP